MVILVVGLGNPGHQYHNTRHNIGFLALDFFSKRHSFELTATKFNSLYSEVSLFDQNIFFIKPQTFMNLSGQTVSHFSKFYKIPSQRIVIIHDDIDLPFETIRKKAKGGHAGHQGVKSIMEALGTDQFLRLRLGVGRPFDTTDVSDYVLSQFTAQENQKLSQLFEKASELLEKTLVDLK